MLLRKWNLISLYLTYEGLITSTYSHFVHIFWPSEHQKLKHQELFQMFDIFNSQYQIFEYLVLTWAFS